MNTCPSPSEQLTIEQILTRTHAIPDGDFMTVTCENDHRGVHVVSIRIPGCIPGDGFGFQIRDGEESLAAVAELFVHAPRLRRELIALREQESEDLAQARADYDSACSKLAAIRSGMIALFDRYQALHICASRYLQEWPNETPKGWSLDELEACLEMPLPELVLALDPDLACQRREGIEGWVVGCKPSLYAVVLQRLFAQSSELLQLQTSGAAETAKLKDAYKTVRTALEGIIDARTTDELKAMESNLEKFSVDYPNAKEGLLAVRALLATMDVPA